MNGYQSVGPANSYLESEVSFTNPVQLVVLLYNGVIQRTRDAAQAIAGGDVLASGTALFRALEIIAVLRRFLNFDDARELAESLDRLYLYMHEELVRAYNEQNADRLTDVLRPLLELHGAWCQVAKEVEDHLQGGTSGSKEPEQRSEQPSEPVAPRRLEVKA